MPFIHVRAYSGRDMEMKKKTAQAIVKAASEAMKTPEESFTVAFEDIEPDVWDRDIDEPIVKPLRDKILLDEGKLLV